MNFSQFDIILSIIFPFSSIFYHFHHCYILFMFLYYFHDVCLIFFNFHDFSSVLTVFAAESRSCEASFRAPSPTQKKRVQTINKVRKQRHQFPNISCLHILSGAPLHVAITSTGDLQKAQPLLTKIPTLTPEA